MRNKNSWEKLFTLVWEDLKFEENKPEEHCCYFFLKFLFEASLKENILTYDSQTKEVSSLPLGLVEKRELKVKLIVEENLKKLFSFLFSGSGCDSEN